jgi:hypothetical protein
VIGVSVTSRVCVCVCDYVCVCVWICVSGCACQCVGVTVVMTRAFFFLLLQKDLTFRSTQLFLSFTSKRLDMLKYTKNKSSGDYYFCRSVSVFKYTKKKRHV